MLSYKSGSCIQRMTFQRCPYHLLHNAMALNLVTDALLTFYLQSLERKVSRTSCEITKQEVDTESDVSPK